MQAELLTAALDTARIEFRVGAQAVIVVCDGELEAVRPRDLDEAHKSATESGPPEQATTT